MNIRYSKKPKSLPVVLSRKEIIKLLDIIKNPKHKLMIALMYSAGLRVSELTKLRVRDLEFDSSYGWVRHGKGNKDRLFIIAERLKAPLKEWIEKEKLSYNSFLFKGQNGRHLSTQTALKIVKKAGKEADIKKNIHPLLYVLYKYRI